MFNTVTFGVLLGTLLVITTVPDVASYSKYGRTCQDIGCLRDEVCVMAEDPCTGYTDKCGRYPTCRKARAGEANCASMVCQSNEYCKTENGVPKCVRKTTAVGYESAGVSYVNGQRVNSEESDKASNNANLNPYANANAPPPEPGHGFHQVNSGSNLGYPPYPSNTGSSSNTGNNGYPPYPSNQGNRQPDLGYPPYPTINRMPVPGQTGYPGQSNSAYPGQAPGYPPQAPGYPQQQYPGRYPAAQYPGYQNYPYHNYQSPNRAYNSYSGSGHRKNAASTQLASVFNVFLAGLLVVLANRS